MGLKELSDAELLGKIRLLDADGDAYQEVLRQYYQELYQRYYFQCYNIARYYGLSRPDAEEAVQDAFIKLFRSIQSFDTNKPFKPWFFKVVLNLVKDKFRENKKHRHTDLEYVEDVSSRAQEKIFEEFHIRDLLRGSIDKLPKKLKSAVILRNYTDMDLEAISAALNVSVRQLHNRLAQAYDILKNDLEEKKR